MNVCGQTNLGQCLSIWKEIDVGRTKKKLEVNFGQSLSIGDFGEKPLKTENKLWPMFIERRGRGKIPRNWKQTTMNRQNPWPTIKQTIKSEESIPNSDWLESYRARRLDCGWRDKNFFFPLRVLCATPSRIWEVILDQKATVNRGNIRRHLQAFWEEDEWQRYENTERRNARLTPAILGI